MPKKTQKNICYIITSLEIGGAERLLYRICSSLLNRRPDFYKFSVITIHRKGPIAKELANLGIQLYSLEFIGKKFVFCLWELFWLLFKLKPDILHTHLLPADKVGLVAARILGIKNRLSTIHNMEPFPTEEERKAVSVVKFFATKVIAVSESVKKNVVSRYNYCPDKIMTIFTAPSIERKIHHYRDINYPLRIINLANLKDAKGQELLIPAMKELHKSVQSATLDVWGDHNTPYGQRVKELIFQNNAEKLVFLKGTSIDIDGLFTPYSLMVSPSLWEGMPLAIIEGMLAGLPMVLSDIPSHRELAKNIEGIMLIDYSDPNAFSKCVQNLIADPERYKEYSKNSLNRSKEFTVEKMIASYDDLYQSFN